MLTWILIFLFSKFIMISRSWFLFLLSIYSVLNMKIDYYRLLIYLVFLIVI